MLKKVDYFKVEGEKYHPWQLIVDKLSYEAMAQNLKTTFIDISS